MPLLFVLLIGLSINTAKSGGVTSLHQAVTEITHSIENPQPADWSKLNQ